MLSWKLRLYNVLYKDRSLSGWWLRRETHRQGAMAGPAVAWSVPRTAQRLPTCLSRSRQAQRERVLTLTASLTKLDFPLLLVCLFGRGSRKRMMRFWWIFQKPSPEPQSWMDHTKMWSRTYSVSEHISRTFKFTSFPLLWKPACGTGKSHSLEV